MILGYNYHVFFTVKASLKSCYCYDFTSHFSKQIFNELSKRFKILWNFQLMLCFHEFLIFLFCFPRLFSISLGFNSYLCLLSVKVWKVVFVMILHLIFLIKFSVNCQKVIKFSEIFKWCFFSLFFWYTLLWWFALFSRFFCFVFQGCSA